MKIFGSLVILVFISACGGGAGTAKSYEGSVWTEKSLENKQDKKFGEPIWVWKK